MYNFQNERYEISQGDWDEQDLKDLPGELIDIEEIDIEEIDIEELNDDIQSQSKFSENIFELYE